ncbi:serine carboxypeptidase-like 18 isoform X1 [Eucalyptus grandis]|uniref:serine carboxypeptidase-like 18 isoform X1 n=1 Tax=Eucalyptus grandis TaxID=71139 RepID=UPI00192EC54E|nr:serine carboxypeptidase-like 18 isoform X1 [Eucalyptus grandis]
MARQKAMLNSRRKGLEKKWACILLVLASASAASSQHLVETLPGFPGRLPFKLETGYISVGKVEFFYYFVQSTGNPGADPLLLFMNGGPGCSGLNAFLYQIGPLKFNVTDYTGGLPSLLYEPNAWTKTANIIFIDAPIGAGFSYATTTSAYNSTDTFNSVQMQIFLRNWLAAHPSFQTNPVFVGSDSYAGIYPPMVATAILRGNEAGLKPYVHLKGMILSCPHTHTDLETNAKVRFAHRLALISDALYESLEVNCGGNFAESTNANCTEDLAAYDQLIELISQTYVLDPVCTFISPKSKEAFKLAMSNQEKNRRSIQEFTKDRRLSLPRPRDFWCKYFDYYLVDVWGNYPGVQEALHVRPGTVSEFFRCNNSLAAYTEDVDDVLDYHKNLTSLGMQVLVFSGDHDMFIPHNGIEEWIKWLNLTIDTDWRPWFVDGQVAGYTRKYTDDGYRLTYATLKGAGHSSPEYKRRECYEMFQRWIHYYPL